MDFTMKSNYNTRYSQFTLPTQHSFKVFQIQTPTRINTIKGQNTNNKLGKILGVHNKLGILQVSKISQHPSRKTANIKVCKKKIQVTFYT